MPSGDVYLYAYKESEGYPDQLFRFFTTRNPWVRAKVEAGRVTQGVTVQRGEKAAYLNIKMTDEREPPSEAVRSNTWA